MAQQHHHHQHHQHGGGAAVADHGGPQIGALFGLPGVTRPTEQVENNDGTTLTLSQSAATSFIFPAYFSQSDVVLGWDVEFTITQTITANAQTVTASEYFPYGYISQLKLNMQNQFDTINITENGIDAAIFQMIRPRFPKQALNVLQQNTISNAYSATANLDTATNYTSASTSLQFTLQLPVGMYFDKYWELDPDGRPRHKQPIRDVFVSPALMSGTNRIIQPKIKMNPAFGSTSDNGAYTVSGGGTAATATGLTATLGITRYGYYQPVGPEDTPLQFDWQYKRETYRFSLSGLSKITIPVPLDGQILALFVRLYDPAANSSAGGAIGLSNVKYCRLLYGSGQLRYDDTPQRNQRRFIEQRQMRLPVGVIAWDLAWQDGLITNQYVLNTMDTTNIQVYLEFTGTQSSSAYAVLGVEALRYVSRV